MEELTPFVDEVYNIVRNKLYSIIHKRGSNVDVQYLYTDHSSGIALYEGYSLMKDLRDDDDYTMLDGDIILLHPKGGDYIERLVELEILFFEPFLNHIHYSERDLQRNHRKIVRVLNYDIPRFLRRISSLLSQEIQLGPYLIIYEKRRAFAKFMKNPIEKKYGIQISLPYYFKYDEYNEAFSVTLPFRIINEEALAPGGEEYERLRRETKVGK